MEPVEEPQLTPALIAERHARLMARLREAAERADRDPDGFRVVAITKAHSIVALRAAWEAGLRSFGENRVQEAEPKVDALPDADWHFVGRLQSNKARRALARFATIHSVDSPDLLQRLERLAHDGGHHPRLLLQVNLTGEESQAGLDPAELGRAELLEALGRLEHARVVGLMTIGPFGAPADQSRATFGRLRELRDQIRGATGLALPELSMGMTADAEAAVAEGATLVRIGTAIFGPRPD